MQPSRRILVVDDDPEVRARINALLIEMGYETATAGDGQEALTVLSNGALPDAIILDLMMPVMSGWEFLDAKAGSETLRAVPVLVLTSHNHESIKLKHVVGFYRKPDGFAEMLETLKQQVPPRACT